MKEFYSENYKTSKEEIKDYTRWWKDLPCLWIKRTDIVKMAILPKVFYRFNVIPINIPMNKIKPQN